MLFDVGGILLLIGLVRAFGKPQLYRGKIFGPILALLSVGVIGMFSNGLFYKGHQMPPSKSAPQVAQKAPDFTLPDQDGKPVSLSQLVSGPKAKGTVLIFYRGYW